MSPEQHEAFLTERSTGLGGSDEASIWNIGYGCRRRLWYQKRGQESDFPPGESFPTGPMELGILLEPYFAKHYERLNPGRWVEERGLARHPEHPELLVHVDRMIHDSMRSDLGVLEIKSVGRDVYYKTRRERQAGKLGLPDDYMLQLQHGMLVTGTTWGAFAIGNRDTGVTGDYGLLHWDVERDEAVCQLILEEAPLFWAQVENGPAPDRLSPDDPRCGRCSYRISCQGEALVRIMANDKGAMPHLESLRPLLAEYDLHKRLFDEAEELLEETKELIRGVMEENQAASLGKRKVYFRVQTTNRLDGDALVESASRAMGTVGYDMQFIPAAGVRQKYSTPTLSRPLRIYANSGGKAVWQTIKNYRVCTN